MSGGGGRRVRVAPAPARPGASAFVPALVVVVVAAVLLVVAAVRDPATSGAAAARAVPVGSVTAVCPAPKVAGRGPDAIGVAAVSGDVGVDVSGAGRRTAALLGGAEVAGLDGDERGVAATGTAPGTVVVRAGGALAPGAAALTAARVPGALGGGLAAAACAGTGPSRWFVGAGAVAGRTSTLLLTNPGSGPGVVDVRLAGPQGPVEAVGGDGLLVEPGETRAVPLDELAADTTGLSVRVLVRRGAVLPAVLDAGAAGGDGTAWVPSAAPPARNQVVPGAQGSAVVQVLNPGSRTTTVEVAVLGRDGRFAASSAEQVEVGAGATAEVRLPASATRAPYGVALRSPVPVVGGLVASRDGNVLRSASTRALTGPAVLPLAVAVGDGDAATVGVQVSNADATRPATVAVSAVGADGRPVAREQVEVAPGTTVPLPRPAGATSLVVEPGGPSVHAAAVVTSGDRSALVPLASSPARVLQPAVEAVR